MGECCNIKKIQNEIYGRTLSPKNSFFAIFLITNECNFRCSYCFEKNKTSKFMTFDTAREFIDKMFDFENNKDYWGPLYQEGDNITHITFEYFGGEPFLNPKLMMEITDYFYKKCDEDPIKYAKRKKNFRLMIITNGSLLQEKDSVEFLDKYNDILNFQVSIEGTKSYHDSCRKYKDTGKGTYDDVYKNLMWYKDRYKKIPGAKITISPFNVQYTYECFLGMIELGYRHIQMKFVLDTPLWTNKHAKIADEQYEKICKYMLEHRDIKFGMFEDIPDKAKSVSNILFTGCGVSSRGYMTIDTDGKFYPCYEFCEMTSPKEVAEKWCFGDTKKGVSKKGKKVLEKCWKFINLNRYTLDRCKQCTFSYHCNTCAAVNVLNNGDINVAPIWHCKMNKVEQKRALIYNYEINKGVKYE